MSTGCGVCSSTPWPLCPRTKTGTACAQRRWAGWIRGSNCRDKVLRRSVERAAAPVRIADGATVRLLRPGDRVDVIAAQETAAGGDARVVARGARVTKVPEPLESAADSGALVVLSVPRATAADLAGASAT